MIIKHIIIMILIIGLFDRTARMHVLGGTEYRMPLNASGCLGMHLNASQCLSMPLNASQCLSMHGIYEQDEANQVTFCFVLIMDVRERHRRDRGGNGALRFLQMHGYGLDGA